MRTRIKGLVIFGPERQDYYVLKMLEFVGHEGEGFYSKCLSFNHSLFSVHSSSWFLKLYLFLFLIIFSPYHGYLF